MKPTDQIDQASGTPRSERTFGSVPCIASRLKVRRAQQQTGACIPFSKVASASADALVSLEGGDIYMTFSDLRAYLNARFAVEEGQTMAEYGVVLTVIAVGTVLAFTALKTGIAGAINNVVSNL